MDLECKKNNYDNLPNKPLWINFAFIESQNISHLIKNSGDKDLLNFIIEITKLAKYTCVLLYFPRLVNSKSGRIKLLDPELFDSLHNSKTMHTVSHYELHHPIQVKDIGSEDGKVSMCSRITVSTWELISNTEACKISQCFCLLMKNVFEMYLMINIILFHVVFNIYQVG